MTTMTEQPPASAVLPAARHTALRLHLLGRSVVVMLTSMIGVALFSVWVTLVAVSPITLVAPLVIPATAVVRAYANRHRRAAGRLLGTAIEAGYRTPDRPGSFRRIWTIERDPASWRDALWLLLHAVVAFVTSTLAFTLFAGAVFYLIYPFLFWVTPEHVFGRPFGGWLELHSVADATIVMPLALVSFALWFVLQLPLTRAELSLTRSLLGRR